MPNHQADAWGRREAPRKYGLSVRLLEGFGTFFTIFARAPGAPGAAPTCGRGLDMLVWMYRNIFQKGTRLRIRARRWQRDYHLEVAFLSYFVVFPMGADSAGDATCPNAWQPFPLGVIECGVPSGATRSSYSTGTFRLALPAHPVAEGAS